MQSKKLGRLSTNTAENAPHSIGHSSHEYRRRWWNKPGDGRQGRMRFGADAGPALIQLLCHETTEVLGIGPLSNHTGSSGALPHALHGTCFGQHSPVHHRCLSRCAPRTADQTLVGLHARDAQRIYWGLKPGEAVTNVSRTPRKHGFVTE